MSGGVLGSRSHTMIHTPEIITFGGSRQIYTSYWLVLQTVYLLIHVSLFSFCHCNLFLLLTMSALKSYKA